MIEVTAKLLSSVWHELEIDRSVPERICTVLQSRNRIVVFVFDQLDASHPLVVLKIARSIEHDCRLRRSVTSAQTVRAMVDPELQVTIPTMAFLPNVQGTAVVVEKALNGDMFSISGIRRRFVRKLDLQCRAFADWLVHFHGCTQTGLVTIDKAHINAIVVKPHGSLGDDSHRRTVERELVALSIRARVCTTCSRLYVPPIRASDVPLCVHSTPLTETGS